MHVASFVIFKFVRHNLFLLIISFWSIEIEIIILFAIRKMGHESFRKSWLNTWIAVYFEQNVVFIAVLLTKHPTLCQIKNEMLIQWFWNVWISIDVYTQCSSGLTICSVHFSIHPQMHLHSMHLLAIVAEKCRSTRDKRVRDRLLLNQNHI